MGHLNPRILLYFIISKYAPKVTFVCTTHVKAEN